MKKSITITMIMILILGMLGGCVNAAASVSASSRTVSEGSAVTVTVSFGQKVSAAQFVLNYNSSILQYSSYSCGGSGFKEFNAGTGKFGYAGTTTDISSVSFRFTAKTKGTANVSTSGLKISTETQSGISVGNASTTITVNEKTQSGDTGSNQGNTSGSSGQTNNQQKPSSNTQQKPNTNNTNNNSNQTNTNESNDTAKEEVVEEEEKTVELAPNELITIDREDVVTLKDETTNVMIKGIPIALPDDDIILKIDELKENNEYLQKIEEIVKEIEGKKQYFDIQLFKNNERIQPNGYVTVYLPIPEGYNKDQLKVYYIDEENGTYELIEGEVQDDYYTFTTDHLSVYALVETPTEAVEETEGVSLLDRINEFFENTTVLYAIIGILILCIIIITIRMNRLKNN